MRNAAGKVATMCMQINCLWWRLIDSYGVGDILFGLRMHLLRQTFGEVSLNYSDLLQSFQHFLSALQ